MASPGAEQKARLLEIGEIFIPKEVDMPCFASRSTAGPDAGSSAHAFKWGDSRVKLSVSKDPESRARLAHAGGSFRIYLDGEPFIDDVGVLPLAAHAPDQAFLNLSGECAMGCAFCAMPSPGVKPEAPLSTERAMKIISISSKYPGFGAVAITSGIPDSVAETNARMLELVRAVRAEYPGLPIGVEAYFDDPGDVAVFRDAGATEMKINMETWPSNRFEKICPNRDFDGTLKAMERAVELFGRGKVTGNLIVGLGESDGEVVEGLRAMANIGVAANLRGVRVGPGNREKLERAIGKAPDRVPAERLLELGRKHRNILEMNNLTTQSFETMCFTCRCCDMVPMVDL